MPSAETDEKVLVDWLVSLKSFNLCDMRRVELPETPFPFVAESISGIAEGELDAAGFLNVPVCVQESQLVNKVVKSGVQTVDGITEQDGTSAEKVAEIRRVTYVYDVLAAIAVESSTHT